MQKNDTERKNELAKQKAHDIKKYKGSPYKSFIQMNRRIDKFSSFSVAIKDNPIASRILLFMIYNADYYNEVSCTYSVLEDVFSISKATVQRAIKYLKDKNFVCTIKNGSGNTYIINPSLAWSSYGNTITYPNFSMSSFNLSCKFAANLPPSCCFIWMSCTISSSSLFSSPSDAF